jgi:uncharacterized membrane protein
MEADPAVTSPVTVNAPLAVGEDERMLFTLIFFVVPLAAIVVSLTSTIGITSLAGSAAVNAVSAVIFVSAISVYG